MSSVLGELTMGFPAHTEVTQLPTGPHCEGQRREPLGLMLSLVWLGVLSGKLRARRRREGRKGLCLGSHLPSKVKARLWPLPLLRRFPSLSSERNLLFPGFWLPWQMFSGVGEL